MQYLNAFSGKSTLRDFTNKRYWMPESTFGFFTNKSTQQKMMQIYTNNSNLMDLSLDEFWKFIEARFYLCPLSYLIDVFNTMKESKFSPWHLVGFALELGEPDKDYRVDSVTSNQIYYYNVICKVAELLKCKNFDYHYLDGCSNADDLDYLVSVFQCNLQTDIINLIIETRVPADCIDLFSKVYISDLFSYDEFISEDDKQYYLLSCTLQLRRQYEDTFKKWYKRVPVSVLSSILFAESLGVNTSQLEKIEYLTKDHNYWKMCKFNDVITDGSNLGKKELQNLQCILDHSYGNIDFLMLGDDPFINYILEKVKQFRGGEQKIRQLREHAIGYEKKYYVVIQEKQYCLFEENLLYLFKHFSKFVNSGFSMGLLDISYTNRTFHGMPYEMATFLYYDARVNETLNYYHAIDLFSLLSNIKTEQLITLLKTLIQIGKKIGSMELLVTYSVFLMMKHKLPISDWLKVYVSSPAFYTGCFCTALISYVLGAKDYYDWLVDTSKFKGLEWVSKFVSTSYNMMSAAVLRLFSDLGWRVDFKPSMNQKSSIWLQHNGKEYEFTLNDIVSGRATKMIKKMSYLKVSTAMEGGDLLVSLF